MQASSKCCIIHIVALFGFVAIFLRVPILNWQPLRTLSFTYTVSLSLKIETLEEILNKALNEENKQFLGISL